MKIRGNTVGTPMKHLIPRQRDLSPEDEGKFVTVKNGAYCLEKLPESSGGGSSPGGGSADIAELNKKLDDALGEYINDVDELLGGDT